MVFRAKLLGYGVEIAMDFRGNVLHNDWPCLVNLESPGYVRLRCRWEGTAKSLD